MNNHGEMAEWFKAHAWNACIGATLSWVRIPLSPPYLIDAKQHFIVATSLEDAAKKAVKEAS